MQGKYEKRAMTAIDAAIAEHKAEISKLESAKTSLATTRRVRRITRTGQHVDPRRAAGSGAIESIAALLRRVGRTTQAELVRESGKHSGTVSHALSALESDKKAVRTGRFEGRSPEWAWIGEGAKAANLKLVAEVATAA